MDREHDLLRDLVILRIVTGKKWQPARSPEKFLQTKQQQ